MAADVQILEKNTATPTTTNKTGGTVRFKNADNATVDNNDPLVIPTTNREYSFEKALRLNFNTAPSVNITNCGFYMDGANGFGTGVKLWGRGLAAYTTPAVPTETNDPPQIPVNGTPAAATDAFTWTSAAQLNLGAGPFTGTGEKGDHVYLVMEAETTAGQGSLTGELATFEYDEI
jgi:hypothetical protein